MKKEKFIGMRHEKRMIGSKRCLAKKSKGITLIALVVTIILLLILASVSITVIFEENGLIQMSKGAKEQYEIKELEESARMVLTNRNIAKEIGKTLGSLKTDLEGIGNVKVEEVADDLCYVTREGRTVSVYENGDIVEGKIDVWNGESIEVPEIKEFNWYIYTGAQLSFLREFVNNGNTLTEDQRTLVQAKGYNENDITITEGTIVYLMNDIDLGARQENGELTSGTEWTPVGLTKELAFKGTFDGNEHTIRGVYVNSAEIFTGFFGVASKEVRNLTIKDSYVEGAQCMGGLVAYSYMIENCHNINTTVVQKEGEYYTIGGITGQLNTSMKKCSNSGTIISNGTGADGNVHCGGVVGTSYRNSIVENCANTGKVIGKGNYVGGLLGTCGGSIEHSYNAGNIIGNTGVGGIVGNNLANISYCSACSNTGNIEGCVYVGGIAGGTGGIIKKCYNEGKVIGVKLNNYMVCWIGGVAGGTYSKAIVSIENCYNIGEINLEGVEKSEEIGGMGGIIGYIASTGTSNGTIKNNYNIGTLEGEVDSEVGGIIGHYDTETFTIENNYYKEGIKISEDNTIGVSKTEAEMKEQDFVDLLNNGQDEEVWEIVKERNNGFPVIKGM